MHHITTSVTPVQRPKDFKSQDFNNYPFLTDIYITYIVFTEIVILIVME